MELRFLGGALEVGRNGMLLEEEGRTLLFDYGIMPSDPPQYPQPAPDVDTVFLTHAHLDHSGMLPAVAGRGDVDVVATPPSQPIAELLAHDSLKICRLEGYPFPYGRADVEALARAWRPIAPGQTVSVGGLDVKAHPAGHIPGSVMYEVDDGSARTLFTGDLNLIDTRLCTAAAPVRCDRLVVEATYSGRNHPDRAATEEAFLDAVSGVVSGGGKVLVPAFATGRTQEVLMLLLDEGYEVALDGMGKTVTEVFLKESSYLRSAKGLSRAYEQAHVVKNRAQRQRALDADVVVCTSGMMEGGPVVQYLAELRRDPRSAVFLTGFQVEGSGGRQLLETGTFDFDGLREKVACEVRAFNFSAHAGHDEIVRFARATGAEDVVFFHTDKPGPLAEAIGAFARVHAPAVGEPVRFL